jgi:hypothetical protein
MSGCTGARQSGKQVSNLIEKETREDSTLTCAVMFSTGGYIVGAKAGQCQIDIRLHGTHRRCDRCRTFHMLAEWSSCACVTRCCSDYEGKPKWSNSSTNAEQEAEKGRLRPFPVGTLAPLCKISAKALSDFRRKLVLRSPAFALLPYLCARRIMNNN